MNIIGLKIKKIEIDKNEVINVSDEQVLEQRVKDLEAYTKYLAENLDKVIRYAEFIAERTNSSLEKINEIFEAHYIKDYSVDEFLHDESFIDYINK